MVLLIAKCYDRISRVHNRPASVPSDPSCKKIGQLANYAVFEYIVVHGELRIVGDECLLP